MVTQENDQGFIQIYEGRTKILVPAKSIVSVVPSKNPAFFNRLAKLNRDISILAYRVYALGVKIPEAVEIDRIILFYGPL